MADDVDIKIGATMDDLVDSVAQAEATVMGLAEVFGVAFSISAIEDFINSMAQLGTQVERTSARLGVSTTSAQEFGVMSKAMGGDVGSLSMFMERLQVSLARATIATSPQAAAFHALGLSVKELIRLSPDQQLDKFADAVSRFPDGGTKTAAVQMLVRGAAGMISVLDEGSKGLETWRQHLVDAGTVMTTQTIVALAKLDRETVTLRSSLSTLAGTLTAQASAALMNFATYAENAARDMTAVASTGELGTFVAKVMSAAWQRLAGDINFVKTMMKDFFTASPKTFFDDYNKGLADIDAADAKYGADLHSMIADAVAGYNKLIVAQRAAAPKGPQVPAINLGGQQALKDAEALAQKRIKISDLEYTKEADDINASFKLMQLTEAQKTQALIVAVNTRQSDQLAAIATEEKGMSVGTDAFKNAEAQKTEIIEKANIDRQKINEQYLEAEAKQWKTMADDLSSAFNSQLRGLLAGTTSWATAMKNIAADMVLKLIESFIQMGLEWAANQAFMLATGKTTAAATVALAAAASAASLPGRVAQFTSTIIADSAQAFAGVFAAVSPSGIPAATAAGLAAQKIVLAQLANVPKFQTGTDYVPQTGLALVHEGEKIIPANENPATGGAASGGIQFHFNGPVIGQQAWINSMIGQISRSLASYQAVNQSAS